MLPVAVCAAALLALLWSERAGVRAGVWIAKPVAAAAFVWAAIAWGALASAYGQRLLAGLVLCWCGDVLLIPRGRSVAFPLGLTAFLTGHLAYLLAFTALPLRGEWGLLAALLLAVFAWGVLRWLRPHVPAPLVWPVRAYVVVICSMTAVAAAAAGVWWGILAGALMFTASDLAVARDRFVSPGFGNAAWGLPLYFAAQLTLARSVMHAGL